MSDILTAERALEEARKMDEVCVCGCVRCATVHGKLRVSSYPYKWHDLLSRRAALQGEIEKLK